MIGMYAIIALTLIAGGVALGIITVVSLGIRREEKQGSLTVDSPSPAASGARTILGAFSRRPGLAYQVRAQREKELLAPHR
jgi:hypothetical protein